MNLILFEAHELGKALPGRDERSIHLLKVLRKKAGDTFEAGLLDGSSGSAPDSGGVSGRGSGSGCGCGSGRGRIEKVSPDGSISFSFAAEAPPVPRLPVRVGIGFPRPIQIRRILRDLSSLGVEAVDFFGTELGEKSYRNTKLLEDGGARAALIEGASQSRDTTIPSLGVFPGLTDWLRERPWEKSASGGLAVPLLVAADNVRPEGAMSRITPAMRPVVLAIGSERGWTDRERDLLEEVGFLRLSLGSRALRTETACVAAAVLAIDKIGELG